MLRSEGLLLQELDNEWDCSHSKKLCLGATVNRMWMSASKRGGSIGPKLDRYGEWRGALRCRVELKIGCENRRVRPIELMVVS